MGFRHLSRKSSHRKALLRNLVDSLFEYESIKTTWPKAKEAQRLADKLITLGKKNTEDSRRQATRIFFRPHLLVPKLFGMLSERYKDRPGGYTRVLRIDPIKEDQAPSAILELVDNPKDARLNLTAKAIALARLKNEEIPDKTRLHIKKVCRYRADGEALLSDVVRQFEKYRLNEDGELVGDDQVREKRKVYPPAPRPTREQRRQQKLAHRALRREQRLKDRMKLREKNVPSI